MKKDIRILMTGIGAPGAPGIIKSLRLVKDRKIIIVGVDANLDESIGIGLVDKVYKIPFANDQKFIPYILEIAKKEDIDVILPLVTRELFVFSENIKIFEKEGIAISVSDYKSLKIANDKYQLMNFCKENNIQTPEFYLVKSIEEFKDKAMKLGYPKNKFCFKPPISNGMRGFRIVSESTDKMNNLLNEKPNNVYIGFEEFIQIAKDSDFFPELLLMEYLPGTEYSVDALANNGNCINVIPRKRDRIKMGISFVGTTENNNAIIETSKEIISKLNLNGNIGFQFKEDKDGVPKIIESNPRVQGTIVLCTAAGCNIVYDAILCALGEKIEKKEIKWETKMIRYWEELYFNENGESFKL